MPTAGHSPLRWYRFQLAPDSLSNYARALSLRRPEEALNVLAGAIPRSSDGVVLHAAGAIVDGSAQLAVLASADRLVEAALRAQLAGVESTCRRLRYVDYEESQRVAAELARRLRRRLGVELDRCQRTAIPRGGWLVAGLLARYLPPVERSAAASDGEPLLVIDDCVFSGVALRRFLRRFPGRRVVFATLFAPVELARHIERGEQQVEAVVAGEELPDRGAELLGTGYGSWQRRWRSRLPDRPHPVGLTDFVCFPWNEPSRSVWNPQRGRPEPGWRLLPSECVWRATDSPAPLPTAEPAAGGIRSAADVVWAEVAGRVYVGRLPSGESWRLEGVAASFWRAILRQGEAAAAAVQVAAAYDADPDRIRRDLDRWLDELLDQGLLERV